MPVTFLDVTPNIVGPGAYNFNTAAWPGGAVLFVNSATGLDNRGRVTFTGTPSSVAAQPLSAQGPYGDPNKPLASVFGPNGALSFCKTGRGDVIIVAPGHVENVSAFPLTGVPGSVTIQGCGSGGGRPAFIVTANVFLSSGVTSFICNNLIFDFTQAGGTVTKGFVITGGGNQFVNCRFKQSGTNVATDLFVLQAGADDFLLLNCEIDATAATGCARAISNPTVNNINRLQIVNCFIHGDYSAQPISILSTGTAEFIIADNFLRNYNASANCIGLAAGNTILGMITYNNIMMAGTANTNFISGGGGTGIALLQNYAWDTKASTSSGILLPAAGTP